MRLRWDAFLIGTVSLGAVGLLAVVAAWLLRHTAWGLLLLLFAQAVAIVVNLVVAWDDVRRLP